MFLTEKEMQHIADLVAERLERCLHEILHRQGNATLAVECVEIDTLPATLRGGAAHG